MNVYQLRDNLKNTIKNKRELLFALSGDPLHPVVVQFLKINIDELERILVAEAVRDGKVGTIIIPHNMTALGSFK